MVETARQSHTTVWTVVVVLLPVLYLASVPPVVIRSTQEVWVRYDPTAFGLRHATPWWADAYGWPYFQLMTPHEGMLWTYWEWWWKKSNPWIGFGSEFSV